MGNRNKSETTVLPASRIESEGQKTNYEKNTDRPNCKSDTQCSSQNPKMRRRKPSCPVRFEGSPSERQEKKLSKVKLQSYIPFTSRSHEDTRFEETRRRSKSTSLSPNRESKRKNSIYKKLMEPYQRLAKHNFLPAMNQEEKEPRWRKKMMDKDKEEMRSKAEMSPTLSSDSGVGGCSPQPSWPNTLNRDKWEPVAERKCIVVKKQSRRPSQCEIAHDKGQSRNELGSEKIRNKDINKVLTRSSSVSMHEVHEVDHENNIREPVRKFRSLLDLVDDLCRGADCNERGRHQKKETGRRISLQKEKKVNLRKFRITSTTWGNIKKYLELANVTKQQVEFAVYGCNMS